MKNTFIQYTCLLVFPILVSCNQAKDNAQISPSKSAPVAESPFSQEEKGRIVREADDSLGHGPWSVVDKKMLPISGDPHDYFSIGYYFWPNPNTPNGLPYIEKDGQANKDNDLDRMSLGRVISSVRKLSLGYYITQDERYAEHAAHLIQVWFLDEKTRMNPHLRFAQAIPGKNDGRPTGIIDTWELPDLLRGVKLIQKSKAWTSQKQEGLAAWFSAYLDWLLQSDFGRSEYASKNNHSTWYLAQISIYADFAGRAQDVRELLEKSIPGFLQGQIAEDGSQPLELKRTRSLHYSIFNLIAWLDIVELAPKIGINSFAKDSDNAKKLLSAVTYLQEQTSPGKTWPYPEIKETPLAKLKPIFLKTALYFDNSSLEESAKILPKENSGRELFQTATLSILRK